MLRSKTPPDPRINRIGNHMTVAALSYLFLAFLTGLAFWRDRAKFRERRHAKLKFLETFFGLAVTGEMLSLLLVSPVADNLALNAAWIAGVPAVLVHILACKSPAAAHQA